MEQEISTSGTRIENVQALSWKKGVCPPDWVHPEVTTTRFYYPQDGVDDGVVLGETHVVDGTPIEVEFLGFTLPTNSYARILKVDEDYDLSVDTNIQGESFRLRGCTATLNGVNVISDSTPLPTTGNNKLVVTPLPIVYGRSLRRLGYALVGPVPQRYLQITFSRIKIGDVVDLAMDDGPTAGLVLLNTGTGSNAIGRNFNNSRWYESEII